MSVFDKLNIKPGIAVIYGMMDVANEFTKARLTKNGFTVQECNPPSDELRDVIVIRRINLPNLHEEAYIYMFKEDLMSGAVKETLADFCEAALNVQDPRIGHLHFIRAEEPRIRARHLRERGLLSIKPALFVDDEDFDDDEIELNEADRDDILAMQIASKSSEDLLDIISKLIKAFALKEQSFAPIDQLLDAAKSKMVITPITPSTIRVNRQLEVSLPEFDGMKFGFSPKMRVVYSLFLRHPQGIFMNSLDDYLQEVIDLIKKVAPGGKYGLDRNTALRLCEPKSSDMNQMISKINHVVSSQIHRNSFLDDLYRITGSKGEVYKIGMAHQTKFE